MKEKGCPPWIKQESEILISCVISLLPKDFIHRTKWAASWQNQQNDRCAKRRLRSAWPSELMWVFAGPACHFVVLWFRGSNHYLPFFPASEIQPTGHYCLSLVTRKPVFGVFDQVRLKPTCSIIEAGGGLKFRIKKLEVLYYLGSENKGADQTARMRKLIRTFVVRIWHKQVFSWHGSIFTPRNDWVYSKTTNKSSNGNYTIPNGQVETLA